jgi:hypothetical protein
MRDAAKEKRKSRKAKRAAGFVLKQIWVKPALWRKAKTYLDRLFS